MYARGSRVISILSLLLLLLSLSFITQLRNGVGELFPVDGGDPDRNVVGVGHFHPVAKHPVPVTGLGHLGPHPVSFDGHLVGGNSGDEHRDQH